MKKRFLALGLLSLAVLTACGNSNKDGSSNSQNGTTVTQYKDETSTSDYTKTEGATVYSAAPQTKKYDAVSVAFDIKVTYNGETQSASGIAAYEYDTNFNSWDYDLFNSNSATAYYDDIATWNMSKFDGLYYEYSVYSSSILASYTTSNWYTNKNGGFRNVALINETDKSARIVVDWNSDGYRTSSVAESSFIQDGKLASRKTTLIYTYSNTSK